MEVFQTGNVRALAPCGRSNINVNTGNCPWCEYVLANGDICGYAKISACSYNLVRDVIKSIPDVIVRVCCPAVAVRYENHEGEIESTRMIGKDCTSWRLHTAKLSRSRKRHRAVIMWLKTIGMNFLK
jgi:hypothetical protein